MGKFNIQTTGGQLSEVEKLATVDLPTGQPAPTPAPTPQGSALERISATASGSLAVPEIAEGIAAGVEAEAAVRERERIPSISERKASEPAVSSLPLEPLATAEPDFAVTDDANGGMMARALQMKNKVEAGDVALGGIKYGDGAVRTTMQAVGALDQTGQQFDPSFLPILSVVTENAFASISKSGVEVEALEDRNVQRDKEGNVLIKKAQQNQQLGQQIHREWQRQRNAAQGLPTDSYADITPEQATLLGDVAKEMYYEANRGPQGNQVIDRVTQKVPGTTKEETFFVVTKYGQKRFDEGLTERKRLFPKQNVRTVKEPTWTGQHVGETRTLTKPHSGQVKKQTDVNEKTIEDAKRNLNQVANVVDRQRNRILLAMALPALSGADPTFANNFDVGDQKLAEFNASRAKYEAKLVEAQEKGKRLVIPEYDVEANMRGQQQKLANALFGIAQERNGANYLTYYTQDVTGRIAPQQSLFDPTTSKPVRFVTRNAVPAMVKRKGDRIARNLEQMYAMMLVSDSTVANPQKEGKTLAADALLPERRVEALNQARPRLLKWGRRLNEVLNQSMPEAQLDAINEAIESGMPLTDPNFPQVTGLGLDPEADADLIRAIQSKGEDGALFVDGLIDFVKYDTAKQGGFKTPFSSYFNAVIDGKTNGLASAGIQLGLPQVAMKTGVLRSQNDMLLDDNADLRDALKEELLTNLDKEGFEGNASPALYELAREIFSIRDLNKATTMTFGYGKELDSFRDDIDTAVRTALAEGGPAAGHIQTLQNQEMSIDNIVGSLHAAYIPSLVKIMDDRAIEVRGMNKATAYLHALAGLPLTIQSYTGFDLNIGGLVSEGAETSVKTKYRVQSGETERQATAHEYQTRPTAAAGKVRVDEYGNENIEYGGTAAGQSVTSPIQSLDAATVAMTASGKSWDRLRASSNGNPYMHTIYDAFKMDAMGFDVILDETNKNWLDATMNWSFLDQMQATLPAVNETISKKITITAEEAALFQQILQVDKVDGKPTLKNLASMLWKMTPNPDEDSVNAGVKRIGRKLADAGHKRDAVPTVATYKALFFALRDEFDLANRYGKMSRKAEAGKKEIREEISRSKNKVYQYYAH